MGKMNFNTRTLNVFSEMGTTYDEVKNLMFDLYKGELGEGVKKADGDFSENFWNYREIF